MKAGMRAAGGAVVVLITVLMAVLLGSVHQIDEVLRPRTAWEQKLLRADLVLYYELGTGPDPVFRLSGTERVLRFVTHARTATTGDPYDPRRTLDYGIRFELRDREGEALWSREIYTRTRQSKAEPVAEGWLRENAFTRDGARDGARDEIWDDRLLYLTLPPDVPVNAELHVSALGGRRVLLRAYARRERTPFQREVYVLRHAAQDPYDDDAVSVGPLRFDQLTDRERAGRASHAWERMAAEGVIERDYRTTSVYYDGLRLPFARMGAAEGFLVGPTEPAVVNVVGPGRISIVAHDPRVDPELQDAPTADRLMVALRGESGSFELGPLELGAGDASADTVLTEGVHSVVLVAEGPGPVRVQVHADRSLPDASTGMGTGAGMTGFAEPDLQRIVHFGAGPGSVPIDIEVESPADAWDQLFRITIRAAVTPGALEGTASIELSTLDEAGRELTRTTSSITAPLAPFEQLMLADGTRSSITEPATIRVIVPADAAVLRIQPGPGAYVRTAMIDHGAERQLAPPYDSWGATGWRWRYAPDLQDRWLPVFPANAEALAIAQQRVVVTAQTRLEAEAQGDGDDDVDGTGDGVGNGDRLSDVERRSVASIEPLGRPPQHLVMTNVEPEDRAETMKAWKPGTFTRIVPNRETTLDLGRGPPRSPRLDWEARGQASRSLGEMLEVLVDGVVVATGTLDTTRGSVSLHGVSRERHVVELRTTAVLQAWIDRPPARGARASLSRVRTVYSLGLEDLSVALETRPGERKVLNVLIYAPGVDEDPEVTIRSGVDGGSPTRVLGQAITAFTPAEREFPLPVAKESTPAMFSDKRGVSPGYPRVISIPLGDDVAAGRHIIRIQASRPLWARFFVYDQAPTRSQSWVRSSMRSDP